MRFNVFAPKKKTVVNYEGANSFTLPQQFELYSAVVTASLQHTFYEASDDRLQRVRKLIQQSDPAFVAKLAVYTRTKMYMRSMPLVLAVELAKSQSGNNLVSKAVAGVVQRADEITELLAYYQLANQRTGTKKLNKLSKQVQRGLAVAFNRFDEYQFAKYNRAAEVKLRDALFIVHPKAVNEQQQLIFDKLAKGTLDVPYTWETVLSALGQQQFSSDREKRAAVRDTWTALIASGKLGYMALLRNLRNIIEARVSADVIADVCNMLSDRNAVIKAKQLPFRFLSAYREVRELNSGAVSVMLDALEDAVKASAENIRGFDRHTRVVLACDVSGSMQKPVSAKSKILYYDIGLMLAMLLQSRCENVQTGMFGDTWKIINMSRKNILDNVQKFYSREGEVGYATNGHLVLKDLINRQVVVDKVMMFTDCQLWSTNAIGQNTMASAWYQYKKIAPGAKLYLFDLAGYGNTPVNVQRDDVYLVAGWSDKIFDVLASLEGGQHALAEIEKIEL